MKRLSPYVFLALILLCPVLASGQSRQYSGKVTDSASGLPLPEVNISVQSGCTGVKTDKNGMFKITTETGTRLIFSHIAFEQQIITVSDELSLEVNMVKKVNLLEPITISANMPENILGDQPLFIIDYEVLDNGLLLLGFDNSEFDPRLFLSDPDGHILSSVPVARSGQLVKDCMGIIYYVSRTTAHEINLDDGIIALTNPIDRNDFFDVYDVLTAQSSDHYFLKKLYMQQQVLVYYNYLISDDTYDEMRVIEDKASIARSRWGVYFDGDEEDIDFQQRIMQKPVYAPLMVINDTVNIFNYHDAAIEKYLPDGTLTNTIPLEYSNDNQFRKQMFYDEVTGKVYALFAKNGKFSLKEVDRSSGKLIFSLNIPAFLFVDEIKVHDGIVYFLYRHDKTDGYKKLFRMRMDC